MYRVNSKILYCKLNANRVRLRITVADRTSFPMQQAPSTTAEAPRSPADLFLAFLEIGLSGFGGVLPFARRLLVE